ncbi:MAG: deoxyribodipyrimidine photo-lyase [Alphaproteobacteria bacterium]|nr:deoxyribodipyrimidine photo-lyase [Alphaproteobacteria bacterium]
MAIDIVWFKRDLRVADHKPLTAAAQGGRPMIALYVFEPAYWALEDVSARHYAFLRDSLRSLDRELHDLGLSLTVRTGPVTDVLEEIHRTRGIARLLSHQETGNLWTYERDRAVLAWTRDRGIEWCEFQQFGVHRRLRRRDGWAAKWDRMMAEPVLPVPRGLSQVQGLESHRLPQQAGNAMVACPDRQAGGRAAGLDDLDGFLTRRGIDYQREMSSPVTAYDSCSRLSAHLSIGTLSLREVHQAASTRWDHVREDEWTAPADRKRWSKSLGSFIGRLHWHCHFMQKLEDAPHFEVINVHRGYDGLRGAADPGHLDAWTAGETGLPMVDACMRALRQTGWLNFRMRAMLMAVASYHLWLPWRDTGLHLARMFTDYEPGIHWNQAQMQSGTTGINTVRIYNPVKQGLDHDPEGVFIRRWLPELARVPTAKLHKPWTMTDGEQAEAGCHLGRDYPIRIVDHEQAARVAKEKIFAVRRSDAFREEADRIQSRHGSRKSGLKRTGQQQTTGRRTRRSKPKDDRQSDFDF